MAGLAIPCCDPAIPPRAVFMPSFPVLWWPPCPELCAPRPEPGWKQPVFMNTGCRGFHGIPLFEGPGSLPYLPLLENGREILPPACQAVFLSCSAPSASKTSTSSISMKLISSLQGVFFFQVVTSNFSKCLFSFLSMYFHDALIRASPLVPHPRK